MAITTQFLTGFEHGFVGSTAIAGGGLMTSVTAGVTASTTAPRNGTYCAHLVAPASTATNVGFTVPGAPTKLVMRFGLKVSARPPASSPFITDVLTIRNTAATTIIQLRVDYLGGLSMAFSGDLESGPTIDTTSWHLIELQGDTVAKTLDWKVDGVAQPQVVATGTPAQFTTAFLGVLVATNGAFTADYDDLIFGTWTVAGTDWYGDGKVLGQQAGVDGTHATITSLSPGDAGTAYSGTPTTVNTMVDDAPGTGGWTATRSTTDNIALRTATVGAYANIGPATTSETSVANAVRALVSYSSSTTTANLAACDVRNSAAAVTALRGTTGGTGATYNIVANQFAGGIVTAPAAGWTASEVNAVRWRFGGCTSVDVNPVPTVQALMLEVDWRLPTDTDVARISLGAGTTPDTRTLHKIKLRANKASGTGTVLLNAALYEGANNRSGNLATSALTTTVAEYTLSIPDASAANITDYTDLELRLWGTSPHGEAVNVEVAEVWLEIPEGAAGTAWDPGTRADALGVTDSAALSVGRAVTQPDALGVTDVPVTVAAFVRDTLADPLGIADARTHDRGLAQADPVALTDLATTEAGKQASINDPVAATDSAATVTAYARPQADAVGVTDLTAQAAAYARTQDDNAAVTDLADPVKTTGGVDHTLPLGDPVGLTDLAALQRDLATAVNDPLGLADTAATAGVYGRTIPDLLDLTDSAALLAVLQRTQADPLAVTDAIALSPALAFADALGVTDLAATVAAYVRAQDDALGLTDVALPTSSGGVNIADALALTDLAAPQSVTQRSVADSLALSDAQTLEVGLYRTLTDLLGVTDLTTAEKILAKALDDLLAVTDVRSFAQGHALEPADALALTDQLTAAATLLRALADLLGVTDLATPATTGAGPPTESHPELNGDILTGTATGGTFDESLTGGVPFGR